MFVDFDISHLMASLQKWYSVILIYLHFEGKQILNVHNSEKR